MAATPVMLGLAVNFGFTGTDGIADANGVSPVTTSFLTGKIILQSADYSKAADEEQIKDAIGYLATRAFYNEHLKATLEYFATGANKAASQTNTTIPAVGTFVNISACASRPQLVGTNWVVVNEPKVTGSNTSAAKISLALEQHPNISAVAS